MLCSRTGSDKNPRILTDGVCRLYAWTTGTKAWRELLLVARLRGLKIKCVSVMFRPSVRGYDLCQSGFCAFSYNI